MFTVKLKELPVASLNTRLPKNQIVCLLLLLKKKKKGSVSTEKLKSLLTKHYFIHWITPYLKSVLTSCMIIGLKF